MTPAEMVDQALSDAIAGRPLQSAGAVGLAALLSAVRLELRELEAARLPPAMARRHGRMLLGLVDVIQSQLEAERATLRAARGGAA